MCIPVNRFRIQRNDQFVLRAFVGQSGNRAWMHSGVALRSTPGEIFHKSAGYGPALFLRVFLSPPRMAGFFAWLRG
jgi:hypothetical protein